MVSFANIHILCLALMALNLIISALSRDNTGHHHHTYTTSPHKNTGCHTYPEDPSPHHGTYMQKIDAATHDVTKYGAVGDGKTDSSKAFNSAWKAACQSKSNNVKITVPAGKTFLVSPVTFDGPCKPRIVTFVIHGTIVAPPRSKWVNKNEPNWLNFYRVNNLRVDGNGRGLIDGQGATWWKTGRDTAKPTAVRFSNCNNLRVTGLKHMNSQRNHVSVSGCKNSILSNLHMTAPANSPNTDGIDVSHSTDLHIQDSVMATGDDCIAVNGGCSNIFISNIHCGPGHGISIGSLGKNGQSEQVESVHVNNCTFTETQNGVRIKSWQGGSGFARNITFTQITFIKADNPVIIDQYYCPHAACATKKSAVKISDVRYTGLRGTSTSKRGTINLHCSQSVPCTSIIMQDVNIKPAVSNVVISAECSNAHGTANNIIRPLSNCLRN